MNKFGKFFRPLKNTPSTEESFYQLSKLRFGRNMQFSNSRKAFFFFVAVWISTFGVVAAEWDCITTAGVFTHSSDCTVSSHIVVTGTLNITGIPDAQGNLPKIIGGGSNRLFRAEDGAELILKNLTLTGGYSQGRYDGGGAIYINNGNLTVIGCGIEGNYNGASDVEPDVGKGGAGIHAVQSYSIIEQPMLDTEAGILTNDSF